MSQDDPHRGRLTDWQEIAEGLAIMGVAADHPFAFAPGQYATLGLPHPDGKLVQRPMSIASSADRRSAYEFLVRHVPGGDFTSVLWQARLGDPVHISGPKGRFLLQDDGRICLFVASGTGLAPFMSMIRTLESRASDRDIVLLHGVSRDRDLAWRSELESLAAGGAFRLRYVATVSRPEECPDWRGLTGRAEAVLSGQLDRFNLRSDNTTIYACGNPQMVEAVSAIAAARGFQPDQVRTELYWPTGNSALRRPSRPGN